jgi:hypothetical protein
MEKRNRPWSAERVVVLAAIAAGVIAGTYGIASAANGSGSSQSSAGSSGFPAVTIIPGREGAERTAAVGPPAKRRDVALG